MDRESIGRTAQNFAELRKTHKDLKEKRGKYLEQLDTARAILLNAEVDKHSVHFPCSGSFTDKTWPSHKDLISLVEELGTKARLLAREEEKLKKFGIL